MDKSNSHVRKTETKGAHSVLAEGRFALGVTVGFVIFISLYLGANIFAVGLTRDEILGVLPILLTLLVAMVSLLISYHALSEQRRMRQAGTDPVVLVHLGQRSDAPMMITFEISNVGAGAAMNVLLEFDSVVQGINEERIVTKISKLTHPIRVIRQNQSVQYNFGTGHELLGDDPIPPFEIFVKYEDIEGNAYNSTQIVDVRELEKQSAHTPPITQIAQNLEKISKDLNYAMTGFKPLQVRTQTKAEYQAEQEENLKSIKAKRKGQ